MYAFQNAFSPNVSNICCAFVTRHATPSITSDSGRAPTLTPLKQVSREEEAGGCFAAPTLTPPKQVVGSGVACLPCPACSPRRRLAAAYGGRRTRVEPAARLQLDCADKCWRERLVKHGNQQTTEPHASRPLTPQLRPSQATDARQRAPAAANQREARRRFTKNAIIRRLPPTNLCVSTPRLMALSTYIT